jgi:asparagine synthase (glutamine-hydrolysing)
MFAFGLWDERKKELTLARDRFGIKPLYYSVVNDVLYFASEAKALLPFLDSIETDPSALAEYLTFQSLLGSKSMFKGVNQLLPGEVLRANDGGFEITKYWDIRYRVDFDRPEAEFVAELRDLFDESMALHLRSDVEIGAYLSGGLDSSIIAASAAKLGGGRLKAFHGSYTDYEGYDESDFAQAVANASDLDLEISHFDSKDFVGTLGKVIYHLDYPIAGPGALPQFQISERASQKVKVVLGGQGGDEIFGGYARYLIGYLEQCLRAGIDGTSRNGNFIVTLESIIPNLGALREYKPLLQKFWGSGLFGEMDERYFKLINRGGDLGPAVDWNAIDTSGTYESFLKVFNNQESVSKEAYFDSMTHFDFRTLLPALLQVEDRMSMAHGIESRVPFLDHKIVEFAATIPADVKFKNGELKRLLRIAFSDRIPSKVSARRDKMGFPVPLSEWSKGPLEKEFKGLLEGLRDRNLAYIDSNHISAMLTSSPKFSRGTWALLSLELWMKKFHDAAGSLEFRA